MGKINIRQTDFLILTGGITTHWNGRANSKLVMLGFRVVAVRARHSIRALCACAFETKLRRPVCYDLAGGEFMNLAERITTDSDICHGKPCIRGLRYPVEMILELLSSGMTTEEILDDYEDLEREDILATLSFAARLSQIKRLEPVSA